MQRRSFLFRSSSIAAAALLPSGSIALLGCNTSWIQTAEQDIPTLTTILDSVLAIAGLATGTSPLTPVELLIFNKAVQIAQASLATLGVVIQDYNASPSATVIAKIDAGLLDAQQNLTAILSSVQIKDPALQASIGAGISLAISVLAAIQLLIPTSKASVSLRASGSAPIKVTLLTPKQIKEQYNTVITAHGFASNRI